MIGTISFSAAALLASFQCHADVPLMLVGGRDAPKLNQIGLPPEAQARDFQVTIHSGDPLSTAEVRWPNDYMRLAANVSPVFETAANSYAFSGISTGGCLFTDKACITQFSIVDRGAGDGKADLLIVPVALSTDVASKVKSSMTVIIRGTCDRTDFRK